MIFVSVYGDLIKNFVAFCLKFSTDLLKKYNLNIVYNL